LNADQLTLHKDTKDYQLNVVRAALKPVLQKIIG